MKNKSLKQVSLLILYIFFACLVLLTNPTLGGATPSLNHCYHVYYTAKKAQSWRTPMQYTIWMTELRTSGVLRIIIDAWRMAEKLFERRCRDDRKQQWVINKNMPPNKRKGRNESCAWEKTNLRNVQSAHQMTVTLPVRQVTRHMLVTLPVRRVTRHMFVTHPARRVTRHISQDRDSNKWLHASTVSPKITRRSRTLLNCYSLWTAELAYRENKPFLHSQVIHSD